MNREDEREYMKNTSIALVMEQLRKRGENVVLAHRLARYEILIKDKDIKIKVKFGKPVRRSRCIDRRWEFIKVIHRSRLWPSDIFDFYILVGFGDNGDIKKIWKISAEDKMIYRKNQIFIPVEEGNGYKEFEKYELKMIEDGEISWIG